MNSPHPPASIQRPLSIRVAAALLCLAAACGSRGGAPATPTALQQPSPTAVIRSSVVDLLGTADSAPVGLSMTPDTGELVLIDARQGVYVLDGERRFRRVAAANELYAQVQPDSEFTDIAALGANRFAITALNDGFLLDLNDGSIRQHFCYVPGGLPGPGLFVQQTDSCAFDPRTQRIIAQPVTFATGNGEPVNAEVGTFPITGGEGNDWHPIGDVAFLAGAATVDRNGELWLCRGRDLFQYDLATDMLKSMQSLQRFGVAEVVGMVFDGDDLMVLDGPSRSIVMIPAALL